MHGAGMGTGVRQTVGWAMALALRVMGLEWTALLTAPDFWIGLFAAEPGVISIGARYLTINGFGHALVAYSLIATFSSQARGRTPRPFLSGTSRVAPFLALLPAVAQGSPVLGVAYISAFCLGVLVAMAGFGGLFGQLLKHLVVSRLAASMRALRTVTALGSMGLGVCPVSSL